VVAIPASFGGRLRPHVLEQLDQAPQAEAGVYLLPVVLARDECELVGARPGQLVSCLDGWLTGWLAGRVVGWLIGLVGWLVGRPAGRSAGWLVGCSVTCA
jgi:hypothetical protein